MLNCLTVDNGYLFKKVVLNKLYTRYHVREIISHVTCANKWISRGPSIKPYVVKERFDQLPRPYGLIGP